MSDYSNYMWSVPDWRTDEMYWQLDNREKGIYREILDECWVSGSITSDPEAIARFVKEPLDYFAGVWAKIRRKFRSIENGTRLVSKRQEQDRDRLDRIRDRRKVIAKKAAQKRWKTDPTTTKESASSMHQAMHEASQTQIQTQKEESSSLIHSPNTDKSPTPIVSAPAEKQQGARPRDLAMDFFSEKCLGATGTPYVIEAGDAVMLAKLRKAFGTEARAMPPDWQAAVGNYFASPLSQYSLADLANPKRYAVFKNSHLDGFNKAAKHANRSNGNGQHKPASTSRIEQIRENHRTVDERLSGTTPDRPGQSPGAGTDRALPARPVRHERG